MMSPNELKFELLMPLNTIVTEHRATHGDGLVSRISSMPTLLERGEVGCFIPTAKLEYNSMYEMCLVGSVNCADRLNVDISLNDGCGRDHRVEKIQDVTGSIINFILRFKTAQIQRIDGLETKTRNPQCLFFKIRSSTGQHFTLELEHSKCGLRRINNCNTENNVVLLRRGKLPDPSQESFRLLWTKYLKTYSMLHTIFDQIYILNQDDQPHKWIECKKRLKAANIYGQQIKYSLNHAEKIVETIVNNAKPLRQNRILFLRSDCFFDADFEVKLFRSLESKGAEMLASISDYDGFGLSAHYFDEFVSKFESCPRPAIEIFSSICKEYPDKNVIIPSIRSTSTASYTGIVEVSSRHYITYLISVHRPNFFIDEKISPLYKILSSIKRQEYPFWNCICLTEKVDDDPDKCVLSPSLIKDVDDDKFQIIEVTKPFDKIKFGDIFGIAFPTKYFCYINTSTLTSTPTFLPPSSSTKYQPDDPIHRSIRHNETLTVVQ